MTSALTINVIAESDPASFLIQFSVSSFNGWKLERFSLMPADHNAVDSTLGYNFQTLHALVVLLKAGDDESVTIELTDDITLHHTPIAADSIDSTRIQVSHSLKTCLPEIKINTTKLWKTLRIWASEYDPKERYFLLTCASVASELRPLASPTADRAAVQAALEKEANRVIDEAAGKIHAHEDRIEGCKAFMALSPGNRTQLLAQIILCVDSPNILAIDSMLDEQLRNVGRPEKRKKMIQRLRGYWMNRACLSLTGEMPKFIKKSELLQCLEDLANELAGNSLPDDFDTLTPPAGMPAPDMMRRQIELVNGGGSRIERSKRSHWKSRNQRQKWLEDDVSMASRLNEYDQKLINTWSDRHGPMCDDISSGTDEEKQKKGCEILDWSHNDAPQWPFTFGRGLVPPFVTQGTYQDLANRLLVGWHPEFITLLTDPGDKK